jgi:hypothetical protein
MSLSFKQTLAIATIIGITLISSAHADRRKYAWTYMPVTIAAEATELELYQTYTDGDPYSWEYRIELEQGVSPRVDFSLYQIFRQNENEDLKWNAFQLRSRMRLQDPSTSTWKPVLYLEYNRKLDFTEPNKGEVKLLFGRDFGATNFSANAVYEVAWAPGEPEHEVGFDFGLAQEWSFKYSLGLETSTRFEFVDGETEKVAYAGPVLSFASGEVWYTLGAGFGLTDESADTRVRLLVGVGL